MTTSELAQQVTRIHLMRLAKRARRTWYRISRDTKMPEVRPIAKRLAVAERRRMRRLLRQIASNL